jgi:hypothetical protein
VCTARCPRPSTASTVVGDVATHDAAPSEPLGEDELVGIFERRALARTASLARSMTRAVRALPPKLGVARSNVMRELTKRVRRHVAYISIDALAEPLSIRSYPGKCLPRLRP